VERHEQVLAAAVRVPEAPAGEACREVRGHTTAQPGLAGGDPGGGPPAGVRGEGTGKRLDLGELRAGYFGARAGPAAASAASSRARASRPKAARSSCSARAVGSIPARA